MMTLAAVKRVKAYFRLGVNKPSALDADQAVLLAAVDGSQPIASVDDRCRAKVRGLVCSIVIGPRGPAAQFEAELRDESGAVRLIWLGQRQILGVQPGRQLVCQGLLAVEQGERVMRNPNYQLIPVSHD
jgi:hypothetical protein